ncbi:MAG TPA: hypothetical protein VIU34_32745, partial [Steroidobacter sp.]
MKAKVKFAIGIGAGLLASAVFADPPVAGHVSDQNRQAQQTPVGESKSSPANRWWTPGEGTP